MTRATRAFRHVLVASALLTGGAACSGAERAADPEPAAGATADATDSQPPPTPSPSGPPSPGDLRTPDSTSGPLSQESFPTPARLGAGWDYAVDPGDAEEGYLGNGTPALARNPREMVQAAFPFGCPRKIRLPVPRHALEVDYSYRDTRVVAVRMSFVDQAQATGFYGGRNANLLDCRGRSGGTAVGPLVKQVSSVGDHAVLSDRTPDSDPWTELAVLDGPDVVLLAAQSHLGDPPLTHDRVPALAAAFRR